MDRDDDQGNVPSSGEGFDTGPPSTKVRIVGAETAGARAAAETEGTDPAAEPEDEFPTGPDRFSSLGTTLGTRSRSWDAAGQRGEPGVDAGTEIGGTSGVDLPHWTEAPTGEVPAILVRDTGSSGGDIDDSWSQVPAPAWREDDADWVAHEGTFENAVLATGESPLGSLGESDRAESQPWAFELPLSGQVPAVGRGGFDEPGGGQGSAGDPNRSVGDLDDDTEHGHTVGRMMGHGTQAGAPADDFDFHDPYGERGLDQTTAVPRVGAATDPRDSTVIPGRRRLGSRRPTRTDPGAGGYDDLADEADARWENSGDDYSTGEEQRRLTGGRRISRKGRGAGLAGRPGRSGVGATSGALQGEGAESGLISRATAMGGDLAVPPGEIGDVGESDPYGRPGGLGSATGGLGQGQGQNAFGPTRPMPVRPSPRPRPGAGLRPPEMPQRVETERNLPVAIVSGVALGVLMLVLFSAGPAPAMVLVTAVVGLAAAEALAAFRKGGYHPATLLGIVATVSLMIASYDRGQAALLIVAVLLIVFTLLWQLAKVEPGADPILSTTSTVFVFGWIAVFGSFSALLLNPRMFPDRHGIAFLLGAVITVILYDVGALAVGRWIGRHPLAPEVSPHKTWEGFVGGAIAALLAAVLVVHFMHPWTLGSATVLALIVAVACPLGDLSESLVKRHLGLKDMGRILPGHGGILDRIDGLLFVLPATFYLVRALHLG